MGDVLRVVEKLSGGNPRPIGRSDWVKGATVVANRLYGTIQTLLFRLAEVVEVRTQVVSTALIAYAIKKAN